MYLMKFAYPDASTCWHFLILLWFVVRSIAFKKILVHLCELAGGYNLVTTNKQPGQAHVPVSNLMNRFNSPINRIASAKKILHVAQGTLEYWQLSD